VSGRVITPSKPEFAEFSHRTARRERVTDPIWVPREKSYDEFLRVMRTGRMRSVGGGANTTQSIRSNPIPTGGVGALQTVPPTTTPRSISNLVEELMPTIAAFRAQSFPQMVPIDVCTIAQLGQGVQVRLPNVGLGYRIRSTHKVTITLTNTNAGAQTVTLSPHFPFNLLQNTAIALNGGEASYSVSGRAALAVFGRQRKGLFAPQQGTQPGLTRALCQVTVGANGTPTYAAANSMTLSGIASISVAATSSCVLTIVFITYEKLAHSRDTLLGALPLQNNQTYTTLTRTPVGAIVGTTQQSPMYAAGANTTAALTSWQSLGTYFFWSLPTDPGLYQPMIQNAYQVIEQPGIPIAATGPQALKYSIPSNAYIEALHAFVNDSAGVAVTPIELSLTNMYIAFNAGTVTPVTFDMVGRRADICTDYEDDRSALPGYTFWDGDETTEDVNITDDASWIDTYSAAEPFWQFDVAAGFAAAGAAAVTREQLVAGATQQVGG
jgi:hypothetical protein